MANEQNYERVRTQLRAFDLRMQRIEQALGITAGDVTSIPKPAPAPRAARPIAQGRGVPASVTVRRVGGPPVGASGAAQPAQPVQQNQLMAALDGLNEIAGLFRAALAAPAAPAPAAPEPAPAEAAAASEPDEMAWLSEEGEQPPAAASSAG
jgi:hypothetical protein